MRHARSSNEKAVLLALGLEDAGSWLRDQTDGSLRAVGDKAARWRWLGAKPNTLFAFCSGKKTLHLGRSPATLSKRFARLVDAETGSSDAMMNAAILKFLKSGKEVRILVWANPPSISCAGFPIDLAAGIEASLVAFLKPPWNKGPSRRLAAASRKRDVAGE